MWPFECAYLRITLRKRIKRAGEATTCIRTKVTNFNLVGRGSANTPGTKHIKPTNEHSVNGMSANEMPNPSRTFWPCYGAMRVCIPSWEWSTIYYLYTFFAAVMLSVVDTSFWEHEKGLEQTHMVRLASVLSSIHAEILCDRNIQHIILNLWANRHAY